MKKIFYYALLIVAAIPFWSCSNDKNDDPIIDPVEDYVSEILILNRGSYYSGIDGSLSLYDISLIDGTLNKSSLDIFKAINNRSIGAGPNAMAVYEDYLYVLCYDSNTMEIIDLKTMTSIKQIKFGANGDFKGSNPRHLTISDDMAYITMYDGYLVKFDCKKQEIETYTVIGNNPEGIVALGDYIYVALSGGMNYMEGLPYDNRVLRILKKDLSVENEIEVGLNPTDMVSNGQDVYVLCMGDYQKEPAKIYQVFAYTSKYFVPGTMMSIDDSKLYVINAPYYSVNPSTYRAYPIGDSYNFTEFVPAGESVDNPLGVKVDPNTGAIVVTSASMENGYPSYSINGYYKLYSPEGKVLYKGETGIDPYEVIFVHNDK